MKQRLFYFLCTVLLSVETGWCSINKINLSNNPFENTIYSNNWPSLKDDVVIIKSNIERSSCVINLQDPQIENILADVASINKCLLLLLDNSSVPLYVYLGFANTLAFFGRDDNIIQAGYDIAVAVMDKIKKTKPSIQSEIQLITTLLNPGKTGIIPKFKQAYMTGNQQLLKDFKKERRKALLDQARQAQKKINAQKNARLRIGSNAFQSESRDNKFNKSEATKRRK